MDSTSPNRDIALIYPALVSRVKTGLAAANAAGYPFAIFEGYRSAARQDHLYVQGRSEPGRVITQAKGWESAHQAGVAVDLAFHSEKGWTWDFTKDDVHRFFAPLGLEFLDFEAAHVQLTAGLGGKEAAALARDHGIPFVWNLITKRLENMADG